MSDAADAIAIIPKNSREEVRVALDEYQGAQLVDVRIFADYAAGDVDGRCPTKKGISLKVERLDDLIAGLASARAEAQRRGLLPGG